MVRKVIGLLLLGASLLVMVLSVASRFTPVHWRFTPWAGESHTVTFVLRGETGEVEGTYPTVGLDTAVYYGSTSPEPVEPWEVNDRVFKINHTVEAGELSVLWPGQALKTYAGVRRFDFHMIWWAALVISTMLFIVIAAGFRRRPRVSSEEAESQSPAAPAAD